MWPTNPKTPKTKRERSNLDKAIKDYINRTHEPESEVELDETEDNDDDNRGIES